MRTIPTLSLLIATAVICPAQDPPDWRRPLEPHKIIANVYYVGTYDLACYLITSPQGHILINTGMPDSTPLIRAGVEKLGFKMNDIKTLLNMQAHSDHVGALEEIRKITGARVLSSAPDAKLLRDGGFSDPAFGGKQNYTPVQVDGIIKDGQRLPAGSTELIVHAHHGHTPGSTSYSIRVKENGKDYNVCILNMGTIVGQVKLVGDQRYPTYADDLRRTFNEQKRMSCDVFLSAHAAQYGLHEKWKPGQAYSADAFVDREGPRKAAERMEAAFTKRLEEDRK